MSDSPELYRYVGGHSNGVATTALVCVRCSEKNPNGGLVRIFDRLFPPPDEVKAAMRHHESSQHQDA